MAQKCRFSQRDGFDFDKDAIPSASASSPPSPFAVYLAVSAALPLPAGRDSQRSAIYSRTAASASICFCRWIDRNTSCARLRQGGTVFMNFVERHYPPVAALTCWLAAALGTKAQVCFRKPVKCVT